MSLLTFLSSSCSLSAAPDSPIKKFTFNFDGTVGGSSFEWVITREENGSGVFAYTNLLRHGRTPLTDTVPAAFMDSLEAICRKHNVHRWDGFKGYDRFVCDGSGFTLNIHYENGKSIYAHGMNEFPKNYRAFRDELYTLCTPIQERLEEAHPFNYED